MDKETISARWPMDFPEDCPPEQAYPVSGVYYCIVKTDPPEPGDFVSLYHRNRRLAVRRVRNRVVTLCQTMGLSVFADRNDAVRRALHYAGLGNFIAQLALEPEAGKILPTPRDGDSHHTWWKSEHFDPVDVAMVVLEI